MLKYLLFFFSLFSYSVICLSIFQNHAKLPNMWILTFYPLVYCKHRIRLFYPRHKKLLLLALQLLSLANVSRKNNSRVEKTAV
jgi:hypothetical protein